MEFLSQDGNVLVGHVQLIHRRRVLLYVVVEFLLGIVAPPLAVQVLHADIVQFCLGLLQLLLDLELSAGFRVQHANGRAATRSRMLTSTPARGHLCVTKRVIFSELFYGSVIFC